MRCTAIPSPFVQAHSLTRLSPSFSFARALASLELDGRTTQAALETLQRRFINRTLLVHTTDGRAFEGTLICTDDTCNVILGSADELRPSSPSPSSVGGEASTPARRWVGMVMLPGKHIMRIEMTQRDIEAGQKPAVPPRPPLSMAGWPIMDDDAYM